MIAKTVLILLVGAAAFAAGNPAVGVEWHWTPRHATVTPNIMGLPFQKLVDTYKPIVRVPGLKAVSGCGPVPVSNNERIVGGTEAAPHSYPWMVAVYIDGRSFCGGSIISEEWILTAGHCLDGATEVEIVAGAHNLQNNEPSQVSRTSSDLIVNENYGGLFITDDIALVHLSDPLPMNEFIAPVCLPSYSDARLQAGDIVNPSGWGRYSDDIGSISDYLQEVSVPVISNSDCATYYGNNVNDGVVCIDSTGGKGTCNGDSGGPLNYVQGGKTYTRGITSYGSSTGCETGYPDAFSRVHYFLSWIETKTGIAIDP